MGVLESGEFLEGRGLLSVREVEWGKNIKNLYILCYGNILE